MDIQWTREFVESYPRFKDNCHIQTFDDSKGGNKSLCKQFIGYDTNIEKELIRLNEQGAGVFFSVNGIQGNNRRKANVNDYKAWIVEMDGLDKDQQRILVDMSPLPPSLIVESKRSLHLYFLASDGTRENREKICWGLCNFFMGDHKIITHERILRLPGFDHCKNLNDRQLVTFTASWETYTEEQMLSSFTNTTNKKEQENNMKQFDRSMSSDDFRRRAADMDSEEMLSLLSGTQRVSNEKIDFKRNANGSKQIRINERPTSSWIDNAGKIGSHDKGGPTWLQRLAWYGRVDWKDLYQFLISKFPSLKAEKPKTIGITDSAVDWTHIVPYTWGTDNADNAFGKYDKGLLNVIVGESGSGKTEYTFFQARQNAKHHKVCYISLEMTPTNLIRRSSMKRAAISKKERSNKTMTLQQKSIMDKTIKELSSLKNMILIGSNSPTIERIHDTVRMKKREGYDLFYIDNMGFIVADGEEIVYTAHISRSLKQMTNEYDVTINLIHHFNKGGSKERGAPRGLASIRSSGKIENDADNVLQVWRDLDYEVTDPAERSEVTLLLQKDREYGDPCSATTYFYKGEYLDHNPYNVP